MVRSLVVVAISTVFFTACGTQLGGNAGCETDAECGEAEACVRGECIAGDASGATTCSQDTDCDINAGEVCAGGICLASEEVGGAACDTTADCPNTQYCDVTNYTCASLPDGWCRLDEQCDAAKPICLATSPSAPGRCVECITRDDCGGAECVQPGVCVVEEDRPDEEEPHASCGANSTETAPGVCVCNEGYVGDGAGHCVLGSIEPEPDDGTGTGPTCPPNSTLIAGQCQCNSGYVLSPDFTSCVPAGSGGDGDGDGDAPGSWSCDPTYFGDALCDCGCGVVDVDCASATATCDFDNCATGTANPANNAQCTSGGGGGGGGGTVPAGWTCTASYYSDTDCDCGCGVLDPVCGSATGNTQCDYDGCATGTEPSATDNTQCVTTGGGGTPTVPASWTCNPNYFSDTDCDCGCGALDAACGSTTGNTQCDYDGCAAGTEPSASNNTQCVSTGGGGGGGVPAAWTCNETWYTDTYCDCGCGAPDPTCPTTVGTEECEYEECPTGQVTDPANNGLCIPDTGGGGGGGGSWTCNPAYYDDGDCDCGCGIVDVDCPSASPGACEYEWCPTGTELSTSDNSICE